MKKGANAPEQVIFKRVIKKRQKRSGKKPAPKFKWTVAPKPLVAEKPSFFSKIKRLIGKK